MGVFLLMAVESSFIPFPSEIVLIPAGYLASKGDMNLALILTSALGGSMVGAYTNYFLALTLGRKFLLRYGKYFFIKEETLLKMELFFDKHGSISTFIGRLIPGVRQLISVPAGLLKMDLKLFSIYTALGASIWASILMMLGYFIGQNQALIESYLQQITIGVIVLLIVLVWYYYKRQKWVKGEKDVTHR